MPVSNEGSSVKVVSTDGTKANAKEKLSNIPADYSLALSSLGVPGSPSKATATTGGFIPRSTTYGYKVTALSDFGETTGTAEQVQATGAGTDTNTITISWSANSSAKGNRVYRGVSGGPWYLYAELTGASLTQFVDDGRTGTSHGSGKKGNRTCPTVDSTRSKEFTNVGSQEAAKTQPASLSYGQSRTWSEAAALT